MTTKAEPDAVPRPRSNNAGRKIQRQWLAPAPARRRAVLRTSAGVEALSRAAAGRSEPELEPDFLAATGSTTVRLLQRLLEERETGTTV
jgi:hypothetical protein